MVSRFKECQTVLPIAITKNSNFTTEAGNLQVFIPDEMDKNKGLNQFIEMYSTRTKASQEYWLFDVSLWETLTEVVNGLNDLPLDLDDDLYLYQRKGKSLELWEFFEMHPTRPRKLLFYCSWNKINGLTVEETSKWTRRGDFEVILY